MERLTSKRNWESASKDLANEFGYSHIWKRLNLIEDILGDTYDLERLMNLVGAGKDVPYRLNREAWEPCDFCKTELNKYPYILACAEYSESNTVYEPGFCPLCGRPLTEEAWAMLEKRLEGTINEK